VARNAVQSIARNLGVTQVVPVCHTPPNRNCAINCTASANVGCAAARPTGTRRRLHPWKQAPESKSDSLERFGGSGVPLPTSRWRNESTGRKTVLAAICWVLWNGARQPIGMVRRIGQPPRRSEQVAAQLRLERVALAVSWPAVELFENGRLLPRSRHIRLHSRPNLEQCPPIAKLAGGCVTLPARSRPPASDF
jgi:hypothetical protein